jgi:hypothetical protein
MTDLKGDGSKKEGVRGKRKRRREEDTGESHTTSSTLEVFAEVFIWDRVASSRRRPVSWRDPPREAATPRRPPPHPCGSYEERVQLCKEAGVPPLEEDWASIKEAGELKQCLRAILDHDCY